MDTKRFNSRAREGRDGLHNDFALCHPSFNSRAREGRDNRNLFVVDDLESFNSRAREGRDLPDAQKCSVREFQLTRPRGARPRMKPNNQIVFFTFQLTRPRGARLPQATPPKGKVRFNSRAREGRDDGVGGGALDGGVSTHAPARGATDFIGFMDMLVTFQLTRPRGARPCRGCAGFCRWYCFNSRAREGRDRTHTSTAARMSTFQLTRPRGARQCFEPADAPF